MKDAKVDLEKVIRDSSKLCERMNKDLAEVKNVEEKLSRLPWGAGAVVFLGQETEKQKTASDSLAKMWVEAKGATLTTLEDIAAEKQKLQDEKVSAENSFMKYKKDVLADFAKMKQPATATSSATN